MDRLRGFRLLDSRAAFMDSAIAGRLEVSAGRRDIRWGAGQAVPDARTGTAAGRLDREARRENSLAVSTRLQVADGRARVRCSRRLLVQRTECVAIRGVRRRAEKVREVCIVFEQHTVVRVHRRAARDKHIVLETVLLKRFGMLLSAAVKRGLERNWIK